MNAYAALVAHPLICLLKQHGWLCSQYTFNRLALQRLMVQAMPWLDWQQASKDAEARTLAEWLWWLLVDTRQQRLAGADVKIGK